MKFFPSSRAQTPRIAASLAVAATGVLALSPAQAAPLPGGMRASGEAETFGVTPSEQSKTYSVLELSASQAGNVFYPRETPTWALQFQNKTDKPLDAAGKLELISYRTSTPGADVFANAAQRIAVEGATPIHVSIPAGGYVDITIQTPIPARFGAYALVADLGAQGRDWVACLIRAPKATPGKVQNPSYAMDGAINAPEIAALFKRLGIKGTRAELGYLSSDEGFSKNMEALDAKMKMLSDNDITLLITTSTGGNQAKMPLGRIRSFLNEKDEGAMGYPGDFVTLPQYDGDFQKWVEYAAARWGWPKGPVNAIELWNEPWEGVSISGWGADIPRYRELYTRMAEGIEAARKEDGVQVLIGGACSSMNTEDKLFPDGKDTFLKWLDFTSIHYQPMAAWPALVPEWQNRKSSNGPVQVWDTESWIANSEDRVAGVIASMRAQGQSRTAGVLHDRAFYFQNAEQMTPTGKKPLAVIHAWAPAAGIAATQKYIGERAFKEILWKHGLPWVFVFNGLNNNADDGTVVVVGDLAASYERERSLFWGVQGIEERKRTQALKAQLAALPENAPEADLAKLRETLRGQVLDSATMTLTSAGGAFALYDFYGNLVDAKKGKISIPLNGQGFFLRSDGKAGSFNRLLVAIKASRIEGLEPVEIIAHDPTAPIGAGGVLRLSITNILNRPITGKLSVKVGALNSTGKGQVIALSAGQIKDVTIKLDGASDDGNTYALAAVFDAGADGKAIHEEAIHVNMIAKRAIDVDGNLNDWKGVLPQPMKGESGGASLTEKAWYPFLNFDEKAGGVAASYLAYDEKNFYFAAKVADDTPYDGNVRFETRDDDSYFYPQKSFQVLKDERGKDASGKETREELDWPVGVPRFSYRQNPDLPSGDNTDNVQIAFNAIPIGQDGVLPNPPGTMPRFMAYKDTDYEYALNSVSQKYGGGTEIWRLLAPGVPRKHFFPHQPKAPIDGGPVKNGKLVMRRDGNTRIIEAALPWSELPDVKKLLDVGRTVKFTCRVNNNAGASLELASNRSVSKINIYSLHNYWANSWANEVEFGWEK